MTKYLKVINVRLIIDSIQVNIKNKTQDNNIMRLILILSLVVFH